MKAIKKIGTVLVSATLLGSTLVGCTSEKNDLYKAFTAEYTSGKVAIQIGAKVNQPLPEYLDPTGQIPAIVEKVNMGMDMVYEQENDLKMKAAVQMNINGLEQLGIPQEEIDMVNGMGMWMDMDLTDAENVAGKIIYDYPIMNPDKYLVLNLQDTMKEQALPFDFKVLMEKSKDMNKQVLEQVATLGIEPVLEDGVYTITVKKENLQNISGSFLKDLLEMQMNTITASMDESADESMSEEQKAEMKALMAEMEASQAEMDIMMQEQADEIIAMLDKVFAEDAIVVRMTLDEDKLLHTLDVAVNFNVNLADFDETMPEGVIDASLLISYVYSDTNQPVEINLPELTEENSMNVEDYSNQMMMEAYGDAQLTEEEVEEIDPTTGEPMIQE